MHVTVEIAGDHEGAALGEARQREGVAVEMAVAVVQVEPVLQRRVFA